MKKSSVFLSLAVFLSLFLCVSYTQAVTATTPNNPLSFLKDFKIGSKSTDVKNLQTFLTEHGYLKDKIDGRFGPKTLAALNKFKNFLGLTPSQKVDSKSLDKINNMSSSTFSSSNSGASTTNSSGPVVTKVSGTENMEAGQEGNWSISVYNPSSGALSFAIDWGDGNSGKYTSPNADAKTEQTGKFSRIYTKAGNYELKFVVKNSEGQTTETSMSLVVSASKVVTSINNSQVGIPVINSLSVSAGPVGTLVTVFGSGFTTNGNKIKFGDLGIENNPAYVTGSNGKVLTFIVPSSNYYSCWTAAPACNVPAMLTKSGVYSIIIINGNGAASNSVSFTVTGS